MNGSGLVAIACDDPSKTTRPAGDLKHVFAKDENNG